LSHLRLSFSFFSEFKNKFYFILSFSFIPLCKIKVALRLFDMMFKSKKYLMFSKNYPEGIFIFFCGTVNNLKINWRQTMFWINSYVEDKHRSFCLFIVCICLYVFLFVSISFSVHSLLFEGCQFVCPSIYPSLFPSHVSMSFCLFQRILLTIFLILLLSDFFLRWIFGFYAFCSRLTFPSLVFHHWLDRSLQNFASFFFLFFLSVCLFIHA